MLKTISSIYEDYEDDSISVFKTRFAFFFGCGAVGQSNTTCQLWVGVLCLTGFDNYHDHSHGRRIFLVIRWHLLVGVHPQSRRTLISASKVFHYFEVGLVCSVYMTYPMGGQSVEKPTRCSRQTQNHCLQIYHFHSQRKPFVCLNRIIVAHEKHRSIAPWLR